MTRTPLEQVAALYGVTDWSEQEWRAAVRQAEEEETMPGLATGFISQEKFELMSASFRASLPAAAAERKIAVLRELVVRPVRASVLDPQDESLDSEFAVLFPPVTRAEASECHRQAVAASTQHISDDTDFLALYGTLPGGD